MFKRILMSVMVMTLVGGSAFTGTRALLSDTVTLTDNTYSTGSIDLQIGKDGDPDWHDATVAGFTNLNLLPGNSADNYPWLRNTSNTNMIVSVKATVTDNSLNPDKVLLSFLPVDGGGNSAGTVFGPYPLSGYTAGPSNLPDTLLAGEAKRYKMTVQIASDVTTSNATSKFNLEFVGTQTP